MDARGERPKRCKPAHRPCFAQVRRPLATSSSYQRILNEFESIVPDLTKRDEPMFTGLAAVTVRPIASRYQDEML